MTIKGIQKPIATSITVLPWFTLLNNNQRVALPALQSLFSRLHSYIQGLYKGRRNSENRPDSTHKEEALVTFLMTRIGRLNNCDLER
jgi:hypothetical protein